MPTSASKRTYHDYVKLPDDGKRYEIIDGELYVNPAPVPRHQRIVGNVYYAIRGYFEEQGGGEVFAAPIDVVLDAESVTQPDLIVVKSDRAEIVREKNVQGAPNLVIEVLSDSTRRLDEIDKRKLYERSGVEEYWIVDPLLELVKIYRRGATGYERVAEISSETADVLTSPLLPRFALAVADLFGAQHT